ncbi:MAG TPA: AtpZ/AtpI family protein [Candidatus Saccharimonadaceae bacterium]|nr:AtpZ/AtpI family protein [Candidatus Saccharimonadaceae bacterium]
MTSPRLSKKSQTTSRQLSAPMILVVTALDTTWRAFLPTIGGTFAGIGLDRLFGIAPIATIVCLVLGTALSVFLIARQLISVRKQQ